MWYPQTHYKLALQIPDHQQELMTPSELLCLEILKTDILKNKQVGVKCWEHIAQDLV